MNRALASVGIAAALVCGTAAPALAEEEPITAKITANPFDPSHKDGRNNQA